MKEDEIAIYPKYWKNKIIKKIMENFKTIRKELSEKHQAKNKKTRYKVENPYTHKHLSERLNEKTRFMQEFEEAKIEPDLLTFINLCNALKISSVDILSEFIIEDMELTNFRKLDTNKKEILKKCIKALEDDSELENINKIEVKKFDNKIMVNRLKTFRENRNIGSRELSSKISHSSGYVSNIENGKIKEINLSTFIDICTNLDCSPNDLLRPFFSNNDLTDYNNLNSNHKHLVNSLIKICNGKQQEFGAVTERIATPEEMAKYGIKLKN